MAVDLKRFNNTIASFDAMNAKDPNLQTIDGVDRPKELVYAARLSEMLNRYAPRVFRSAQTRGTRSTYTTLVKSPFRLCDD